METIYDYPDAARFVETTNEYEASMFISKNHKCRYVMYIFRLKDINGKKLPYSCGTSTTQDDFCFIDFQQSSIRTPLY